MSRNKFVNTFFVQESNEVMSDFETKADEHIIKKVETAKHEKTVSKKKYKTKFSKE